LLYSLALFSKKSSSYINLNKKSICRTTVKKKSRRNADSFHAPITNSAALIFRAAVSFCL